MDYGKKSDLIKKLYDVAFEIKRTFEDCELTDVDAMYLEHLLGKLETIKRGE